MRFAPGQQFDEQHLGPHRRRGQQRDQRGGLKRGRPRLGQHQHAGKGDRRRSPAPFADPLAQKQDRQHHGEERVQEGDGGRIGQRHQGDGGEHAGHPAPAEQHAGAVLGPARAVEARPADQHERHQGQKPEKEPAEGDLQWMQRALERAADLLGNRRCRRDEGAGDDNEQRAAYVVGHAESPSRGPPISRPGGQGQQNRRIPAMRMLLPVPRSSRPAPGPAWRFRRAGSRPACRRGRRPPCLRRWRPQTRR